MLLIHLISWCQIGMMLWKKLNWLYWYTEYFVKLGPTPKSIQIHSIPKQSKTGKELCFGNTIRESCLILTYNQRGRETFQEFRSSPNNFHSFVSKVRVRFNSKPIICTLLCLQSLNIQSLLEELNLLVNTNLFNMLTGASLV